MAQVHFFHFRPLPQGQGSLRPILMARRLVGPNYRVLLGTTVLTGGVLMVFSDIISRTLLSPNEIPIGIVAAVIGAPYFLYLLVKS